MWFCVLYVSARKMSSLRALPLPPLGLYASIVAGESPEAALEQCKSKAEPLECLVGLETALYCEAWNMRDPQRTDLRDPAECFTTSFVFKRRRALFESACCEQQSENELSIALDRVNDVSFTNPESFTLMYTAALVQLIVHHRYLRALRRVSLHLPSLEETCSSLWSHTGDAETMQQTCLSLRVPLDSVEEQVRAVRCCVGALGSFLRAQRYGARLDMGQLYPTTDQAWRRYDRELYHAINSVKEHRESLIYSVKFPDRLFEAWDAHFETMPLDFAEKGVFELLANVVDPRDVSSDVACRIAASMSHLDLSNVEYPKGFALHVKDTDTSFGYGEQNTRKTVYDGQVHTEVPIGVEGETVQGTRTFYESNGRGILVDDAGYGIPTKIWSGVFKWNGDKTMFTLQDGLFFDYSPDTDVRMAKADTFIGEEPQGEYELLKDGSFVAVFANEDGTTQHHDVSMV